MISFREMKLRKIAHRLSHFELQEPEPEELELTEKNLQQELVEHRTGRFLNFYTKKGIENALREYGVWDYLIKLGFKPHLMTKYISTYVQLARITDDEKEDFILMEIQARIAYIRSLKTFGVIKEGDLLHLLGVEWLLMQNPNASFTTKKPPLPGQNYPGLGLGYDISVILEIMAERLKTEGILGFPLYYHNGVFYNNVPFHFIDPKTEGELLALKRDLKDLNIAQASWAIKKGLIFNSETKKPYQWRAEEMVSALSERLKQYFSDRNYQKEVNSFCDSVRFCYNPEDISKLDEEIQLKLKSSLRKN